MAPSYPVHDMTFFDHFSAQAGEYAAFRPRYPDALGAALAAIAPGRSLAWDCATGSGQAASMLARHFERVVATDASAAQIANAEACDNVAYGVARANTSDLPSHSCDLVTVAQAAHWLDLPSFYAEARRVLKPGGVIAVWCYTLAETGRAEMDDALRHFQNVRVGPFWPNGRNLVEERYASLPFPFTPIPLPATDMTARWRLEELLGYVGTWSAVARCRQFEGADPLRELEASLASLWPVGVTTIDVRWPLHLRAGTVK